MDLGTALELKDEILWRLPSHLDLRDGETPPPIGIGVAPSASPGQYRIAVRPRFDQDLSVTALAFLRRTTSGEIDLRVTGTIAPLSTVLMVGGSTAHHRGRTGTIGFFARRIADDVVGFVSNNHVIAAEDSGVDGDEIIHPGRADGGRWPANCVAELAGDYPRLIQQDSILVDCAFARLDSHVDFDPGLLSDHERLAIEPVAPSDHLKVRKIGRTTLCTTGVITAFSVDHIAVNYSCGPIRFRRQVEIESIDGTSFSQPGDSGSLVFTEDLQPLALVYASSAGGGTFNMGLTYANPIGTVLDTLGVTLLT